jgi:hypothetical protein
MLRMLKNNTELSNAAPLAVIGGHLYQLQKLTSNLTAEYFKATAWRKALPVLWVKRVKAEFTEHHDTRRHFLNECQIINSLNHPQLPQRFGRHDTDGLVLACHWLPGVPLDIKLKSQSLDTLQVQRIMHQLVILLSYLHKKHQPVIHGQLSLQHVLMDDGQQLALSGFDQARFAHITQLPTRYTQLPSANSLSPEQARGEAWGPSSDYFQLGLIYYQLLTSKSWIQGDNRRQQQLCAAQLRAPDTDFLIHLVDLETSQFIAALLQPNPADRPQLPDIQSYYDLRMDSQICC